MLLVFVVLSNVSVSAQSIDNKVVLDNDTEIKSNSKQGDISTASNMNSILWFMGTKQDPNSTISKEGINRKKQIMTSGVEPNHLLIKTFLKKAVNFKSLVV
jgi:hypothetical protein